MRVSLKAKSYFLRPKLQLRYTRGTLAQLNSSTRRGREGKKPAARNFGGVLEGSFVLREKKKLPDYCDLDVFSNILSKVWGVFMKKSAV